MVRTPDPAREALGRRALALALTLDPQGEPRGEAYEKLERDIAANIEARDFWKGQSDAWEQKARELQEALIEARDFWKGQSDAWEQRARELQEALAQGGAQTVGETCTMPRPHSVWSPRRLGRAGLRFLRSFRS
jgi:hypothetical protein